MEENQQKPLEENPQDQIAEYHADIQGIELEGYEHRVRKARNALFWTAGLLLFWQILAVAMSGGYYDMETFLLLAPFVIGFILLGIWTKKKPYTAIIVGICLFIAHWVLVVVSNVVYGDGENIFKAVFGGIVIRIIIFVNLIRPLSDAKELQKIKDEKGI